MRHRHLTTNDWSLAAIDSCLDRGDLPDWRELFAEAKRDKRLAKSILELARRRGREGASVLAQSLIVTMWPELQSHAPP